MKFYQSTKHIREVLLNLLERLNEEGETCKVRIRRVCICDDFIRYIS